MTGSRNGAEPCGVGRLHLTVETGSSRSAEPKFRFAARALHQDLRLLPSEQILTAEGRPETTNQGRAVYTRRIGSMKTTTHAVPPAETVADAKTPADRRATFPIESGIYGVGRLANHLNALLAKDSIADWHLAGWTDWKHTAIRIDFASPEDARHAAQSCREGGPGVNEPSAGLGGTGAHAAAEVSPAGGTGATPAGGERRDGSAGGIGVWEDEGGAQRGRAAS